VDILRLADGTLSLPSRIPPPAAVTLAEALFGSWAGRKMSLVMQMPPLTCFAA
jgi:hypothetical protein